MSIIINRQPLEKVLKDPKTTAKTRKKLEHVLKVRKYAQTRIGLKTSGSYKTLTKLDRKYAAWNVSASEKLRLKAHTWWFPIVGSIPYLGFFSEKDAEAKAAEMRKKDLDVLMRPVPAYSTLGWFDDPLLSPQLRYSNWYLTGLVIHESAHATLWFPDDVRFNESFANFVEYQGTIQYYQETAGPESKFYQNLLFYNRESKMLSAIFRSYASKLNNLYNSKQTNAVKHIRKKEIIAALKSEFMIRSSEFKVIKLKRYAKKDYNNANFLSYLRYDSGQEYFQLIFKQSKGNWKTFFSKMNALKKKTKLERHKLLSPDKNQ